MVQRQGTIFNLRQRPAHRGVTAPVDPLPQLLREAENPLYTLQTVFPFVMFADRVVIRANHIDVITGLFFFSAATARLNIADLRQVEVLHSLFFATLELYPLGPLEPVTRVRYLWKHQAMKARRIISGLMASNRKKVDFSRYTQSELVRAMEKLGTAGG